MSGGRLTEYLFGWVIGVTMQKLMIDLETKSDVDITKAGVYRYADSPYFDILLFAYSVDDAPVKVVDLACGEQLPEEILNALTDDRIQKHAFNASFERVCLSVWLRRNYPECFISYGLPEDACGNYLSPKAWRCTMVAAAYLGLPLSLAGVGAVLQLQQQKMSEGKALIRYFCVPYDHVNGIPVFHAQTDAPEKWNVFLAYNKRDVETEQAIEQKIARFPVPDFVWQEYVLDQSINDRGIQLDLQLVQQAIRMDTLTKGQAAASTEKSDRLGQSELCSANETVADGTRTGVRIVGQKRSTGTAENRSVGLASRVATSTTSIKILGQKVSSHAKRRLLGWSCKRNVSVLWCKSNRSRGWSYHSAAKPATESPSRFGRCTGACEVW